MSCSTGSAVILTARDSPSMRVRLSMRHLLKLPGSATPVRRTPPSRMAGAVSFGTQSQARARGKGSASSTRNATRTSMPAGPRNATRFTTGTKSMSRPTRGQNSLRSTSPRMPVSMTPTSSSPSSRRKTGASPCISMPATSRRRMRSGSAA